MLDIWESTDEAFVKRFCELHSSISGEFLNPDRVEAYRSKECPYKNYELVRLEIKPHVLNRSGRRQTISAHSVSYVLLTTEEGKTSHNLIPLNEGAESIYEINSVLNLILTKENIQQYIIFYGHLVTRVPFYFFNHISQIQSFLSNMATTEAQRGRETVCGIFASHDGNRLDIEVIEHSHFLLGKYFTLRMPCLYQGKLYVTRLRLSENGMPKMDSDDALTLEGMFDEEENRQYYPLDKNPTLRAECHEKFSKANRVHKTITGTLFVDMWFQILILPLFLFHLFVMLAFGSGDKVIFSYFERLRESNFLNIICLLVGAAGTGIAVFRYTFIEFAIYVKRLVPGIWSQIGDQIEEAQKKAARGLGIVIFTCGNAIEFSLRVVMALSLLLYGLFNAPFSIASFPRINFGQAIVTVLVNIPLLGGLFKYLLGQNSYLFVQYSPVVNNVIKIGVWFMFSTVILGLTRRAVYLATSKE